MANNISSMANIGRTTANSGSVANMSSNYSNMPLMNQYYPSNVPCFPEFLNSGTNSLFNYSSLDMGAAFDQLFRQTECQNREVPNFMSTTSNATRRPPDFDPDIISID